MRSLSISVLRPVKPTILALAAVLPWAGIVIAQNPQAVHRRSTDAPVAAKGKYGQDLFIAIGRRDMATLESLLKKGADANARNGLEMVPLNIAAATHNQEAMSALIAAGAQVEAETPYGTSLTFAALTGNLDGAKMLLDKGSDPNMARVDGDTVLMMAAQAGNPGLVAELINRKAKVNEASFSGATALAFAARWNHVESGRILLKAGAKPDLADNHRQTPLMAAAKAGYAEFVKLLVESGANVNLRDENGWTPLMLAAAYGDSPETVRILKEAGAKLGVKDSKGWTAGALAASRGYAESASILGKTGVVAKKADTRKSVENSLILMEKSMLAFSRSTQCISCHQEGLGRMTTASAKARGFKFSTEMEQAQIGRLRGALGALKPLHEQAMVNPEAMKQLPLIELNEINSGYGWMMAGMADQNDAPTAATAAIARVMAKLQSPDGSWTFSLPRVPMQSSNFTFTALALRAIGSYAPKSDAAQTSTQFHKAKQWLLSSPAVTSDDLAFRLLGLKWSGATLDERKTAVEEILAAQRPDGGWAQLPGMRSDAYATGQALYALAVAGGVDVQSDAYRKGTDYLLRTQDSDGSWFVHKRATPLNNYFDAAFPHGESQYSSFNGTAWATMALLETLPKK
jgi:ankyrin repeat protein